MYTIIISPMQHITPPPSPLTILFQLHAVRHQAAPTIQLLPGEIIIHADAVLAKAAAATEQHMLDLPILELETSNSARRAARLDELQSNADHWCCTRVS